MKQTREIAAELGARLRRLRIEAGLTQDELAARMGAQGTDRRKLVERLEQGRTRNPTLRTVAFFLRGCGARWSAITRVLERVERLPAGADAVGDSGFAPARQQRLRDLVEQEARRYLQRLAFPNGQRALAPDRQLAAAGLLRNYRVVVNLVEQDVADRLQQAGLPRIDWAKYKAAARSVLGVLWQAERRSGAKKDREARIAAQLAGRRERMTGRGLEPDRVREIEEIVRARFARLKAGHPELFGRAAGLTPGPSRR